jgi:hypothetical protein
VCSIGFGVNGFFAFEAEALRISLQALLVSEKSGLLVQAVYVMRRRSEGNSVSKLRAACVVRGTVELLSCGG